MTTIPDSNSTRVLVLAPHGRDAEVACTLLADANFTSVACRDLAEFQAALGDDTLFAVVAEEAFRSSDLAHFTGYLALQPAWSDLPFVVLTHRGGGRDRSPVAAKLSSVLGNVTFLERPFHATTFISVARTANRGRQRQFEARARIDELNEGEQRLRTAIIAGRLGSWELDLTTLKLTATSACKALFGRAPEEPFAYQDLVAAIHPDDRGLVQNAVRTAIDSGADYAVEHRTVWPDGTVRWAEIRARLVPDRGGSKRRFVGVSSDVTESRKAREQMRLANETLEKRVAERTAQLEAAHASVLAEIDQRKRTEEQLRQAQKLEMIGQLTGGVAHDFNNLLMAVLGNLELLKKQTDLEPKIMRLVDGAVQGAQRGAALTQRLLAFARRQELEVKPTDLAGLIDGMANLLQRSVGDLIEVRLVIPDTLPPAMVDGNQIELALLNLAVNARDAMPTGGILSVELDSTEVRETSDVAEGSYLRLRVKDTGQGMDAVTLEKATEPFFSTKGVGKGTGLGLSMVHGLAVQLKGTLRLASEVDKGTTADILLPVTSELPSEDRGPAAPVIESMPKVTILVVDDDALIAMSTVDMLEDLGHDVLEARTAGNALEIIRDNDIDLLITDYSMPKMNGAQLAAEARRLKPKLPIIIASGYADLPTGVTIGLPRIAKPYHQSQLAAEIARALSSVS